MLNYYFFLLDSGTAFQIMLDKDYAELTNFYLIRIYLIWTDKM